MSAAAEMPWPVELRYQASKRLLAVSFDDGSAFSLPAELLRVESPSAEVQGHGSGGKTIVAGKENVTIRAIEPIGRYAVRLVFSDGHDTGLYSWSYLQHLGRTQDALWADYLSALKSRGLSRERPG